MKKIFYVTIILILVGLNSTSQINLSNGLVACFPFNGNANDVSGNGNNGIVSGATLAADRNSMPNSAYLFDGTNDFISVANPVISSSEMSISFWSKTNSFNSHVSFMLTPDIGSDRFSISINYNHRGDTAVFWDFGNISGSGRLFDFPLPSLDRTWEHYTFISSKSKDSMFIYRNGLLFKAKQFSDTISDTNRILKIGSGDNANFFNGLIDDVKIYNRVLNSAEIRQLSKGATCSSVLAIPDLNRPKFRISFSPNPFHTQTILTNYTKSNTSLCFKLYSTSGKLVKEVMNIKNGQTVISREGLSNGIYFYKITDSEGISLDYEVGKLLIQ
ncbi:MAG: LamG-like jellyroll fold domain-containing protein [Flavobacteriales bacterium]